MRDWFYFSPLEMDSVESLSNTSEADHVTASQETGLEMGRSWRPRVSSASLFLEHGSSFWNSLSHDCRIAAAAPDVTSPSGWTYSC